MHVLQLVPLSVHTPAPEIQLLTIHDLAKLLKVSRTTVRRMAKDGRLPAPLSFSSTVIRWKATEIAEYLGRMGEVA